MNNFLSYEFPLKERIRLFMRLEHLFQQFDHCLQGTTVWDKRAAIDALHSIITLFTRNDIKSAILKELERHTSILTMISKNEDIDDSKLQSILQELQTVSQSLYQCNGKIGIAIIEGNELLKNVTQRTSIPGGSCSFDLPGFHYWLEQAPPQQHNDLEKWSASFSDIRHAIDLVLRFIRQSSSPSQEIAQAGFFQDNLDQSSSYQLIQIRIDKTIPCYAEISGGKHCFSIRFMMPSKDGGRPTQTQSDIPFEITRCLL